MCCTPTLRWLIVLTLPPRYHCPLNRLPASRLLLPRNGLERSDFVHGPSRHFGAKPNLVTTGGIADITGKFARPAQSRLTRSRHASPWRHRLLIRCGTVGTAVAAQLMRGLAQTVPHTIGTPRHSNNFSVSLESIVEKYKVSIAFPTSLGSDEICRLSW